MNSTTLGGRSGEGVASTNPSSLTDSSVGWTSIYRAASSAASGLIVFWLAKILGPGPFGKASFIVTVSMVIGAVSSAGVTSSILRFSPWARSLGSRLTRMERVALTSCIAACPLVCIVLGIRGAFGVVLSGLLGGVICLTNCRTAVLISMGKTLLLAKISAAATVAGLIATLVGFAFSINALNIVLSFYSAMWLLLASATAWSSRNSIRPPADSSAEPCPEFWSFFRRGWLIYVAQMVVLRMDALLLGWIVSPESFGRYFLMIKVCEALAGVLDTRVSIVSGTVPGLSPEAAFSFAHIQLKLLLKFSMGCGICAAVSYALFLPHVLGNSFGPDRWWIILLLPSFLVLVSSSIASAYFSSTGNLKPPMYVGLVGFAFSIPLYLILVPNFGIPGAVGASSAIYLIQSKLLLFYFFKQ
jgi:O-antigen/teichoic acid export membrane protein